MLADSTALIFDEACFNVPTLGELYKLATLDAMSKISNGHPLIEQEVIEQEVTLAAPTTGRT
jgi:hypothetical protein